MMQLQIAGVRCRLLPETGAFVSGPNLLPFRSSDEPPADLTLCISDAPGWQAQHQHIVTHDVRRDEAGWTFLRRAGWLEADATFRSCHAHLDPEPPEVFTGQPWLMLALWGYLTHRNGLFLHGACCEIAGKRMLLLGAPQVGKSTLARLIVDAGGASLTDEYPFVTHQDGVFAAHATPWPGVVGDYQALSAPLDGIFFLRHARSNELERLDPAEASRRLFANNRFFTWSPSSVAVGVELIDLLARQVPVYDFGFVPTPEAVEPLVAVL